MLDTTNKPAAGGAASADVAGAMNKVLAAERESLAAIARCRTEAERILEQARQEARRIDGHAERVSRDIHARTARFAAAQAQRIAAAARGAQTDAAVSPLDTAVRSLAARITGGADD